MLLHSTSSAAEIETQLSKANCNVMFTCQPLLSTCNKISETRSIATYLFDLPNEDSKSLDPSSSSKKLAELAIEGSSLQDLEGVSWSAGQGREQVAFLCPTSGTSGKQVRKNAYHD